MDIAEAEKDKYNEKNVDFNDDLSQTWNNSYCKLSFKWLFINFKETKKIHQKNLNLPSISLNWMQIG